MRVNSTPQKLYSIIDLTLRKKGIRRYQIAKKIGVSKQSVSDNLLRLKDGKSVQLKFLLDICEVLNIELFNFNH